MSTALQYLGAVALAGLLVIAAMACVMNWASHYELPMDGCPARGAIAAASSAVGTVAAERRDLHDVLRRLVEASDVAAVRVGLLGIDLQRDPLIEEARALLARVKA